MQCDPLVIHHSTEGRRKDHTVKILNKKRNNAEMLEPTAGVEPHSALNTPKNTIRYMCKCIE